VKIGSIRAFTLGGILAALGGCSQQVALERSFWDERGARVGIAATALPPVGHYTSEEGLADDRVDPSILVRFAGLNTARVEELKKEIAQALQAKGLQPVVLDEAVRLDAFPQQLKGPGYPERDFSDLGKKMRVDKVIVLQVNFIGMLDRRKGRLLGYSLVGGQLVDLRTGKLLWLKRQPATRPIREPTDEWANQIDAINSAISASAALLAADFSFYAR
jgi:hypothetical protein